MTKNWTKITGEARKRALQSDTFTDDPKKLNDSTYLVKDIQQVINAFVEDIENGDTVEYNSPEEFLNAHGINWK